MPKSGIRRPTITTATRSSWSTLPEKSEFDDYLHGRDLYNPSCGKVDACHEAKDPKEYSREYMINRAETETICPDNDLFEPFVLSQITKE